MKLLDTTGVQLIVAVNFGENISIEFVIATQSKKYCNILVVSTKSVVCNNNCLLISIIHRPIKMMKDVDTCSRQINTLIYRYPVHIYSMH